MEQFAPTDVSSVARESTALADCLIFFVPTERRDPGVKSKAELEALVARLGGKVRAREGSGREQGFRFLGFSFKGLVKV